jgi:hypothetical protein
MDEWDQVREAGQRVAQPEFGSLVSTARRRQRRDRAFAATAVVGVLVTAVGVGSLWGRDGDAVQPAIDPTRPDTVGVRALPVGTDALDLAAGRYRVPLSGGLAFEIDMPDGSSADRGGLYLVTDDDVLKVEIAGRAFGTSTDPCRDPRNIVPAGPTVDDLAAAIAEQPVLRTTRAVPVTLGGARGVRLGVSIPDGFDASACAEGQVGMPGEKASVNNMAPGYSGTWWILDVDGRRVVLHHYSIDGSSPLADAAADITFTTDP